LPFKLTESQNITLAEVNSDLHSGEKMMRLLQGDVGSGKTIVALLAMLPLIDAGYQIAFMMPTTLLAGQQLKAVQKFLGDSPIRAELLTGNVKGKKREDILRDLAEGKIHILIGTHALFQDPVNFQNLGLNIIDEQHRFGVEQRIRLAEKNPNAHMLLMSATPIPRTLTMAFFGDMDVSRITEKPSNRKPITTIAAPISRIDELYASVKRALEKDEKIYWICPLVEESEKINLANVTARFEHLQKNFGDVVGLVHGKMKEAEKAEILQKFLAGQIKILVATTVIEVGIDVPDATVIFIENADKFGLSQLHQLRGRVGRGKKASSCVLLYDGKPTTTAQARLKILKESNDGFFIAEEDLNLRGGGEVLGTKQSGDINFRFAELPTHTNLLIEARKDAREILNSDPNFTSSRGKNLRLLLQLFNMEANLRYVSG
jgi:ATP-dependent DNA helicase RecG